MSRDHALEVFDESPLAGREANTEAWRGYFDAFPRYLIHPHELSEVVVEVAGEAARDRVVAIVGHTTGSHLDLPDDEERTHTLIWLAHTSNGRVSRWRLIDDTPANRAAYGLQP
jgi:hypothetical protein